MSFFFKHNKNKQGGPLPPATRNIKSSDGPQSSIPVLHTSASRDNLNRSPQPPHLTNGVYGSQTQLDRPATRSGHEEGPVMNDEKSRTGPQRTLDDSSLRDRANVPDHARQQSDLQQQQHQLLQSYGAPPSRAAPTLMQNPTPPLAQHETASPYPWSRRQLTFKSPQPLPFPRYGAAVNAASGKDGSIYVMGGLVNGSTVKGDLWTVEAGDPALGCFAVQTFAEGPGPRVGHASLLVGNAFIVFGGDTKTNEADVLDDTLYLLNTSTKQWSRATPAGTRPSGRYGHTLNILGSKIYIFGGQVEGFFFNDLVAFDLNALQQPDNKWNILVQNTIEGGPPHGQIPPARTNHTVVTWNDRLYLFGGTDGVTWFNDVWCYDPRATGLPWTQLDCIGYIPTPREGHAAALVGDVMYIFGGRTEEGNDLGDLAAFKIPSRRWFTFQNMGPSPSPRSGHSMTSVGKSIYIVAGEPSSAPRDAAELSLIYCLDTAKIRYPADANVLPTATDARSQTQRQPSTDRIAGIPGRAGTASPRLPLEQGSSPRPIPVQPAAQQRQPESAGQDSAPARTAKQSSPQMQILQTPPMSSSPGMQQTQLRPQNAQQPSSMTGITPRSASVQSNERSGSQASKIDRPQSPANQVGQPAAAPVRSTPPSAEKRTRTPDSSRIANGTPDSTPKIAQRSASPARSSSRSKRVDVTPSQQATQPVAQLAQSDARQVNYKPSSQGSEALRQELDAEKSKNAWFVSELALARKAGYSSQNDSPLDERNAEALGLGEKPLFDALLKMRNELVRMQSSIAAQASSTAERIAQIERQRDNAINEAVFAKAKLAGHSDADKGGDGAGDHDRSVGLSRKLAAALAAQSELSRQIEKLNRDKETEARARESAEESNEAAQQRLIDLDHDRQQKATELERIRDELFHAQKSAREATTTATEASSAHSILTADHKAVTSKLENAMAASEDHNGVLQSLRDALAAANARADTLEKQLGEERAGFDKMQTELMQLRADHEERNLKLDSTTKRLRDAEEIADKHAAEAQTHRMAVFDWLGKQDEYHEKSRGLDDQRVDVLQKEVEIASSKMREHLESADNAHEKLRRAEERIAGLEAYQEQASREGLGLRKQIQAALRDVRTLTEEKTTLMQQVQSHHLEINAVSVQHTALKDVLQERGVNPSELRRARAADSPNSQRGFTDANDETRIKQLEQQLETATKTQEELKSRLNEVSEREDTTRRDYEEKLTALDSDHQAAAKYLRGTEKMLSKMKQELQRVKTESAGYQQEVESLRAKDHTGDSRDISAEETWKQERSLMQDNLEAAQTALKEAIGPLEAKIKELETDMSARDADLQALRTAHQATRSDLDNLQSTHDASRSDIERLARENSQLENRAEAAEQRVQLLLDQVENSVDHYRRRVSLPDNAANASSHRRGPSTVSSNGGPFSSFIDNQGKHNRQGSDGDISSYDASAAPSVSDMGNSPRIPNGTAGANGSADDDGRNSMALDTLADELDALRSHWETTNKNYRLSDKLDFENQENRTVDGTSSVVSADEMTPTTNDVAGLKIEKPSSVGPGSADQPVSAGEIKPMGSSGGLTNWRRALETTASRDSSPARPESTKGSVKLGASPLIGTGREASHE